MACFLRFAGSGWTTAPALGRALFAQGGATRPAAAPPRRARQRGARQRALHTGGDRGPRVHGRSDWDGAPGRAGQLRGRGRLGPRIREARARGQPRRRREPERREGAEARVGVVVVADDAEAAKLLGELKQDPQYGIGREVPVERSSASRRTSSAPRRSSSRRPASGSAR